MSGTEKEITSDRSIFTRLGPAIATQQPLFAMAGLVYLSYIAVGFVAPRHWYRGNLMILAIVLVSGKIFENFFGYLRWLGTRGIFAKHLPPLHRP